MGAFKMEVTKVNESGYKEALIALALNKKKEPWEMFPVAEKLAPCDGGHNKFLEFIDVWLVVNAPRYWWSEADTYRLTSKSSESTMHTLQKEVMERVNTGKSIDHLFEVSPLEDTVNLLVHHAVAGDIVGLKQSLPESFMQKRIWKMSYKNLRNIIGQRKNHRLPHWGIFCEEVLRQVDHPELLGGIA